MECINNKEVVVEPVDDDVCPVSPPDRCVSNTIVDVEIGINGLMSIKEVNLRLIEEIKSLRLDVEKLKTKI